MKEFYANLKDKREEKGISLEEIERKTCLSTAYLKAIEEGNLDALPHGYERIYLRRYAREIGLDPEEVLRDFDLFTGRLTPKAPRMAKPEQPSPEGESSSTSTPRLKKSLSVTLPSPFRNLPSGTAYRIFWIGIVVILVAVAGYITYQQYIFEKKNRTLEIKEITISDLIENYQRQDSALTPQLSGNTVVQSARKPQVIVQMQALERTWVREIRDDKDTTEYILTPGLKRHVEAVEHVRLLLGRADGVRIVVNGDTLERLGEANQVVTNLLLGKEGIITRRIKTVQATAPVDTAATDSSHREVVSQENTLPDSTRMEE